MSPSTPTLRGELLYRMSLEVAPPLDLGATPQGRRLLFAFKGGRFEGPGLAGDVLTTGGSTRETMQVAKAAGGQVVGAASIVDRGARPADLGVPYISLLAIDLPTYEPDKCPLCAQGLPVVKPGSRPVAV